jgi:hypothetical protein
MGRGNSREGGGAGQLGEHAGLVASGGGGGEGADEHERAGERLGRVVARRAQRGGPVRLRGEGRGVSD